MKHGMFTSHTASSVQHEKPESRTERRRCPSSYSSGNTLAAMRPRRGRFLRFQALPSSMNEADDASVAGCVTNAAALEAQAIVLAGNQQGGAT